MTALVLVLLALSGALAFVLGRTRKELEGAKDDHDATKKAEADLEVRRKKSTITAQDIIDAAPRNLPPGDRVDAVDRWVRENADSLGARRDRMRPRPTARPPRKPDGK